MKQRPLLLRQLAAGSCRYAWQSLKNCVKLLLGRKLYRDAQLVFFRQYILHRLGLRRIRAITCIVTREFEGPGSQAFHIMKTMNCARAFGLEYLHSPFAHISQPDRPMPQWVAAWESLFNLGAGEALFSAGSRGVINYYGLQDLDLYFGRRAPDESLDQHFKRLIPELRRKYYLNKSPRTNHVVTVAINTRRNEVSPESYSYMYTGAEKILQIACAVKSVLDSHAVPFQLRVYGQGTADEFAALSRIGAELFLNADPIWTMQEIVEADILVVAKSHFSYCAGILSHGLKIFEPCGVPNLHHSLDPVWQWTLFTELDGWLSCREDGSIDRAAFDRGLAKLLEARRQAQAATGTPATEGRSS